MAEKIAYKSIIMRCDRIRESAFLNIPKPFIIENYHPGMEAIWVEIQKAAGEFEGYADNDILEYFSKTFLQENCELSERCLFLKDATTGTYIGVCCAWFSQKENREVPVLHWLAVIPPYRNRGCARMLITEMMKIFQKKYEDQSIYLHTQPSSYPAIKLYHDFGFHITKEDYYGSAVNEYDEAMIVLEKVMKKDVFENLKRSAVR